MEEYQLTVFGGQVGLLGVGFFVLCMIFGTKVPKIFRFLGTLCLAILIFDYLPNCFHWRYVVVCAVLIILETGLWIRTKDNFLAAILAAPFFAKLYIAGEEIGYWRFVILGFLALASGTIVSLCKQKARDRVVNG